MLKKSNTLFDYSSDQTLSSGDDHKDCVFGTHGIKRTASEELSMEYGLPSKFPAYSHPWTRYGATANPFDFQLATPGKLHSADDDIEAELAEGVAQSLSLSDESSTNLFGRKRKIWFNNERSTTCDDDMLGGVQSESSKRMKMDWEDDSEGPGLVLSKEVKSVMKDFNSADLISSPESLIIERIRNQNSMALMPYVPPEHTIQENDSNQNSEKKDRNLRSVDDISNDEDDPYLPIENMRIDEQNPTSPLDAMEEDTFGEIDL